MKILFLILFSSRLWAATITGAGSFTGAGVLTAANTPPGIAVNPSPADDATRQALAVTLSWTGGGGATSYKVYTAPTSGALALVSTQPGTSYVVTNVAYSQDVYWRIDSVNDAGTTTGTVWNYTIVTPFTANLFNGFENGSDEDLLTTTILDNDTHGSIGTWTLAGGANTSMYVDVQSSPTLYTPVTVGGSTYLGTGTRVIRIDNSKYIEGAIMTFTAGLNDATAGMHIMYGDNNIGPGSWRGIDLVKFVGSGGSIFAVAQQKNVAQKVIAHTDAVGSSSEISISLNTWYWLQLRYSKTDLLASVAIYNATTGAQVGSTVTHPLGNAQTIYFECGPTDAHDAGPDPSSFTYIDNLVISTTGTFPLGP